MAKELLIRTWRVFTAEPSGSLVWFDPEREEVRLYARELPPEEGVLESSEGDDLNLFGRLDSSENRSRDSLGDDLPF